MNTIRYAACLAFLLFAAAVSAQDAGNATAVNISGTWNMGLQGDHVIPTALTLQQDGRKLTGTIMMPTQRIGERKEVVLDGEFVDHALSLSGTVEGAAEPTRLEIAGKLNDDGSMEGTVKTPHGKLT